MPRQLVPPGAPRGVRYLSPPRAQPTQPIERSDLPSELGGSMADVNVDEGGGADSGESLGALGRGAAQGATMDFGDEAQGGIQAVLRKYIQNADTADARKPIGDLYREERDAARRENAAAKKAHPFAFGAGEVLGGAPLAAATGGGATAPASVLARTLKLAGASAAMGGATGLGASEAQDVGAELKDAGEGALIGGGTALVLPAALKAAKGAAQGLAQKGDDVALNLGRRVLQGGSTLTGHSQKALSDEAVRAAEQAGAFRPLGTTERAYNAVDAAREVVGDQYGKVLDALERAGIKGPEAEALAQKLAAEGRSVAASNTNPAVRDVYDAEARALRAMEPGTSMTAPDYTVTRDSSGRLRLAQTEEIKRNLQNRAKYNRVNVAETPQNEARKQAASLVRQSVEDEIDQQAAASGNPVTEAIADQFKPVKQQLGSLIEAGDAAEKAVAQAQKRTNSLQHAIAAAPHLATGDLGGAAKSVFLEGLMRKRGPSTGAWLARALSDKTSRGLALAEALRDTLPTATVLGGELASDRAISP